MAEESSSEVICDGPAALWLANVESAYLISSVVTSPVSNGWVCGGLFWRHKSTTVTDGVDSSVEKWL